MVIDWLAVLPVDPANETIAGSTQKSNTAKLQAIGDVAAGNFSAQTALITTLLANSGLFNQLKSRLGNFGGLTAETIAALAIATNHLQAGAVTADKITADTALIQKLIANVGLFNQLQAQLGIFGGLGANSIAANSITTKHLTIANTDNICTNPTFDNGSNEGWSPHVTVVSTTNAAEWGSNYLGLINNTRDTGFNSGKPFNVQNGDSYFISCYVYHYLNPSADFRLGLRVHYSDGSVNWLTFQGRSANNRNGISFPSGIIRTLDEPSKKIVSASLFLQMAGTTGAMGGGYYFSNVYLRKMASSELIVDGAITTQKILSKAITTDKIAANAVTATELLADTALINKLVATSALFDSLVARLAVFGGLTANSIASDAILGRHIKAGEKISSPIIEGGEVRLIGSNIMKIESATPFGPDSLVYWRGPRLLVGGNPDWPNIRKSNATRWTDVTGAEYFGGSLSAGVLKTGISNPTKTIYQVGTYIVELGPYSSNGKPRNIIVSYGVNGYAQRTTAPNDMVNPSLGWHLERQVNNGGWIVVTSGHFQGVSEYEFDGESRMFWVSCICSGSLTYTDNLTTAGEYRYRIKVLSYTSYLRDYQSIGITSTEQ